jgi:hypothetical protein
VTTYRPAVLYSEVRTEYACTDVKTVYLTYASADTVCRLERLLSAEHDVRSGRVHGPTNFLPLVTKNKLTVTLAVFSVYFTSCLC